ncbi:cache domain-containing protein [Arcobacter sp. FWKO B]|uniref:sensor domain-containing diguanylate cyclase n=1 Tax=Arcobacter sp. FWKO B TaxID=2593672 RepID=UPI0018A47B93|nr:cache domain-containing protein [Arcobacter sp. FWKO B]QOG13135.1 diguanylate cyclase [Arcobacter sp. FWKO B]
MKLFNSGSSLIRLVILGPILFIPLLTIVITYISLDSYENAHLQNLNNTKELYILQQKNLIESKVTTAVNLIDYENSKTKHILSQKVKERVENAYLIAINLYNENKHKPQKEIQKIIIDALRPMIWNQGESFVFILDFNGIFYLAPTYLRHLEGSSIIDFKDASGRYVIKEEIAIATSDEGQGFLWDTFTRPNKNPNIQYPQLAYVKNFGHFNWYMGSAEYLETTQQQTEVTAKNVVSFLNSIDKSKYLFIIDTNGNLILHDVLTNLVGTNILDFKDDNGDLIISNFIQIAQSNSNEFTKYKILNPITAKSENKVTFIKKVPNSNWIVGGGFYESELQNIIKEQESVHIELYEKEQLQIYFYSLLVLIVSILVSVFISRQIANKFKIYQNTILSQTIQLKNANEQLETKVQQRTKELESANNKLQEIATIDFLTKINNRYSFMKILESEVNISNRYDTPFSILMFDIDYFKKINDTYGHDIGDKVLYSICDLIQSHLRKADVFARLGGEEFVILLNNTTVENAKIVADNLRELVANHKFDDVGYIKVSFGVAEFKQGMTVEQVMKNVDLALYSAKNTGRNKTVVFDNSMLK